MKNKRGESRYYSDRIRLEKLKHKTWLLIVAARVFGFLALIISLLMRHE